MEEIKIPEIFEIKDSDGNVVHPKYRVSRDGRVWSLKGKDETIRPISKMVTPSGNRVTVTDKKKELVHVLIANTFIPNPSKLPYIQKISNDSDEVENLKWISRSDRAVISKGQKKPVVQVDFDGNVINTYESIVDASKETEINRHSIGKTVAEINHTAGGFEWNLTEVKEKTVVDLTNTSICKPINGFGKYYIFKDGRVYSTKKKDFLNPTVQPKKSPFVTLQEDNEDESTDEPKKKKNYNKTIPKLLAEHFP